MFLARSIYCRPWRTLVVPLVVGVVTVAFLIATGFLSASRAASTFVVINANDSGPGSLRQAMIDANANPGLDTITFNIGSGHQTIKPQQRLPTVTDPVVIDGTSQPGFSGTPIIEIDSSNQFDGNGLFLDGGDSTVRSLVLNNSPGNGILSGFKGGNRIEGCYIGTDVTGTIARPNHGHGIFIWGSNNIIGGTTPAARNVISANIGVGVSVSRGCCTGNESPITGNVIRGNHIGVNVQGNAAIPNHLEGVNINSFNSNVPVTGNTVGGTEPGAGNVISGNLSDGIGLGGVHVMNNTLQGNLIGTDASGNFAINNNGHGIECTGNNNLIGGSVAGARNVISGNSANGVHLEGSGNILRGNIIGANLALTAAIPNFFHGVSLNGPNSVIGGTNAGEANVIAFNGADGIAAVATSATTNSFRANSIFSNGFLAHPSDARIGIDLGAFGPTPNDAGDGDTGANNLQNFPVITSVTPDATSVNVKGTLNSAAATLFALDFYANSVCDGLGFGEGARFIGSGTVMTNGSGDASFDFTFQGAQPAGQVYTATATDPSGNTSEFSQCSAPAPAIGSVSFSSTSVLVSEAAGMAFFAVNRTGGSAGPLTVGFSVIAGTATAGVDFTATEGTLTFVDGEVSKMFSIPIHEDSLSESFETAKVILNTSGPLDTLGSQSTATLTIEDNDPLPTVSIRDVHVIEGNSGTTTAFFSVTLSATSGSVVSVSYSTQNGSASSVNDYEQVFGSLTFNPGETIKQVVVTVKGDVEFEPDETFFVNLTNATHAVRLRSLGKGTILNDDGSNVPLVLILEEQAPDPIQAAALDSVLFLRDPFPVVNEANLLNHGPDRNTRVMVFVRNLPPGVVASGVTINLVDPGNQNFNLVAEDVRSVSVCDCVQVIFRLPDNVLTGKSFIRVDLPGSSSNSGTIRIRP